MAGYRSKVATRAKAFDLKGYVRNLPDGRVKIIAEGADADLERFIKAIKIENPPIKVEDIKAEFSEATGAYEDFFEMESEWEIDASMSLEEIRTIWIEALVKALGPVDAVRFLQIFDLGKGDYTKERSGWLDQNLDEIITDIKAKRD